MTYDQKLSARGYTRSVRLTHCDNQVSTIHDVYDITLEDSKLIIEYGEELKHIEFEFGFDYKHPECTVQQFEVFID